MNEHHNILERALVILSIIKSHGVKQAIGDIFIFTGMSLCLYVYLFLSRLLKKEQVVGELRYVGAKWLLPICD